jgi:Flp pilus assembly protein TadD
MPKGRSREGEHVVYTDHTIARRPGAVAALKELRPFAGMTPGEREWALAEPAKRLGSLEKLAAGADVDAAVLVQLAQLYDTRGMGAALYERALRLEPDHATAMANLGIYRMQEGRTREALALWAKAFAKNPGMLAVGLNLAMGQMQAGDKLGAAATLRRVLRFHPDSAQARDLLGKLL